MFRPPFLYAIFLTVLMLGCGKPSQYKNISLVTESKDKKYRVWLYEHSERFDRNFDVWVERTADGFKTNIFQSPDEGLAGTERIVWKGDHSEFVLVGKEFLVESATKAGVEELYLWYDLNKRQLHCNASQASHPHPRFSAADVNWEQRYENEIFRNPKAGPGERVGLPSESH